jgi:hypothetical protein
MVLFRGEVDEAAADIVHRHGFRLLELEPAPEQTAFSQHSARMKGN